MRPSENIFTVKISNTSINLDKGAFTGDIKKAMAFIQSFCDKNNVSMKSYGRGYADLIVNDVTHDITPYGIDINMMIRFCGGNPADFQLTAPSLVSHFNDPAFPKMTIKQFSAMQLQIPEEKVLDTLVQALAREKQTPENTLLLEKALAFTVNASGAIILMINTNDGLQLVYGNSQRRKKVVASNGACEANESMADTATREFREEFGNPAENGILCSIVRTPQNCRSLEVTNKIGATAAEIANRIIDLKADKGRLYINISSLYVNETPVNIRALQQEIADLNERLQKSAPYYAQAVKLVFGSSINLSDPVTKLEACKIINDFKTSCKGNMTVNFMDLFALNYDEATDAASIKEALLAIIDLTENNALGLLPKSQLEVLLKVDLSQKENLEAFKKEYFAPSFENIVAHQGQRTPSEFLAELEKLSSQTKQVTLGLTNVAASTSEAKATVSLQQGKK